MVFGRDNTLAKKYTIENLLPSLKLFVSARREVLNPGFTDNGGAIHSVERIVDILSVNIVYPNLTHLNNYKKDPNAIRSTGAVEVIRLGKKIL